MLGGWSFSEEPAACEYSPLPPARLAALTEAAGGKVGMAGVLRVHLEAYDEEDVVRMQENGEWTHGGPSVKLFRVGSLSSGMQIQAEMDRMHKTHGPQFKQKPPPLSTLADAAGRAVAPAWREEAAGGGLHVQAEDRAVVVAAVRPESPSEAFVATEQAPGGLLFSFLEDASAASDTADTAGGDSQPEK